MSTHDQYLAIAPLLFRACPHEVHFLVFSSRVPNERHLRILRTDQPQATRRNYRSPRSVRNTRGPRTNGRRFRRTPRYLGAPNANPVRFKIRATRRMTERRRETQTRISAQRAAPLDATAVLPLDVFGSGSKARAAFKFPWCCCGRQSRIESKSETESECERERERERERRRGASLRKDDISDPRQERERPGCHRMAQNVNPFSSMQNTPTKAAEEKQSLPKDNHAVSKRLQKELMVLMMNTEQGVSAFPEGENLFKWIGTITGPRDTVYAGLTYKLTLEFPHSYPYSAPIVRFATPCFHPNVDTGGNICLDILKDKWSALYDVRTILLSIQSLLGEPNNESPLNLEAAELWNNQTKYKKYLMEEYHRALDRTQSSRNQQDS